MKRDKRGRDFVVLKIKNYANEALPLHSSQLTSNLVIYLMTPPYINTLTVSCHRVIATLRPCAFVCSVGTVY